MTLDEWRALQGERQKPIFNIRKIEGDEPVQKGEYLPTKKKGDDSDSEDVSY